MGGWCLSRLFPGNHTTLEQTQLLYQRIYHCPDLTRQALAEQMDLPATTLNRTLDRLIALGLVSAESQGASSGGRRPDLFRIIPGARSLLGIELNGAASRLVLTDLCLTPIGDESLAGWPGCEPVQRIPWLIGQIKSACQKYKVGLEQVLGIGLVGPDVTATATEPDTNTNLADISLVAVLQHHLQMPAWATDPILAATWAGILPVNSTVDQPMQYWFIDDAILLGSVEKIFPSSSWQALPVSHLQAADPAGGQAVTLAAMTTRPGLVHQFQQLKNDTALTWTDLLAAASQGKKKATVVMQRGLQSLAMAIYNAAVINRTRQVVLGGPLVSEWPSYGSAVCQQIARISQGSDQPITVTVDTTGPGGRALGAAVVVMARSLGPQSHR